MGETASAPHPIRLSNEETTRAIHKTVSVPVTIRPEELANTLTRDEVVRLCGRHNIQLKKNGGRGGPKTKIDADEIAALSDRLRHRDIEGLLIGLERVLPLQFRHLSDEVARFYRGKS